MHTCKELLGCGFVGKRAVVKARVKGSRTVKETWTHTCPVREKRLTSRAELRNSSNDGRIETRISFRRAAQRKRAGLKLRRKVSAKGIFETEAGTWS